MEKEKLDLERIYKEDVESLEIKWRLVQKKRKELNSEAKMTINRVGYKGQEEKTSKAILKLMGKGILMWYHPVAQ